MVKKAQSKPATDNNSKILKRIAELIPLAPDYWMDVVATKMGKGVTSIFYYTKGRGMRKGYPNYVLRELTKLVKKENAEKELLIQNSSHLTKVPKTCNPKNPK